MLPPAPLHRLLRFIFVALAAGSGALLAQTQPASGAPSFHLTCRHFLGPMTTGLTAVALGRLFTHEPGRGHYRRHRDTSWRGPRRRGVARRSAWAAEPNMRPMVGQCGHAWSSCKSDSDSMKRASGASAGGVSFSRRVSRPRHDGDEGRARGDDVKFSRRGGGRSQ